MANGQGLQKNLTNNWQWVRCQDVIDVRDGTHETPKYVAEGFPLITSKNLASGFIDFTNVSFISKEDHEDFKRRSEVNKGDVLFAMIGTIGNPVIVETDKEFSIKNVALFKFSNSPVLAKYFCYVLESPIFLKKLSAEAQGVTQKFVSLDYLRNLLIPLPPLTEQRRIAALLDKADKLRRTRRYAAQLSDTFLQAVFVRMFGDARKNTMGWEFRQLGEISDIASGVTKGQNFNGRPTVVMPYLRVANVQDGYLDLGEIKTIEALASEAQSLILQRGDILMTEGGDFDKLGRGALWNGEIENCIHQNHIFRVRANRDYILPNYFAIFLLMPYAKNYFLKCSKQTSNLATINMTQLKELPVPFPPLALQEKFARIVQQFERLRAQQREAERQAEHLFQALLHKSFS
jgi:type I restriction enzyme, S subunit